MIHLSQSNNLFLFRGTIFFLFIFNNLINYPKLILRVFQIKQVFLPGKSFSLFSFEAVRKRAKQIFAIYPSTILKYSNFLLLIGSLCLDFFDSLDSSEISTN